MSAASPLPSFVAAAANAALEKKARGVLVLDVRSLGTFTDFHLLCHGTSSRQVQAICRAVREALEKAGLRSRGIEGFENAEWVLLDYSAVIVHAFLEERRAFYDLESLWGDAPKTVFEDSVPSPADKAAARR